MSRPSKPDFNVVPYPDRDLLSLVLRLRELDDVTHAQVGPGNPPTYVETWVKPVGDWSMRDVQKNILDVDGVESAPEIMREDLTPA